MGKFNLKETSFMSGILEGVKVLDFGRYIAGPFCGALLADYGHNLQAVHHKKVLQYIFQNLKLLRPLKFHS